MNQSPPIAQVVDEQIRKVQIPMGLIGGDSFIVTPENGRVFTVIVPEGEIGGNYINIVVPDEALAVEPEEDSRKLKVSKATVGAAVVGGIAGAIVLGPLVGLALAGAAAYATTRETGKIGETARKVGDSSYNGMEKAGNWVESKIAKVTGSSSSSSRNINSP